MIPNSIITPKNNNSVYSIKLLEAMMATKQKETDKKLNNEKNKKEKNAR